MTAGIYRLDARVASRGAGGTFHVEVDGADVTGPLVIPDTTAWQNWTTISHDATVLPAGPHVLRVVVDRSGSDGVVGNLNWIELSSR
jgi:hypothetical protein